MKNTLILCAALLAGGLSASDFDGTYTVTAYCACEKCCGKWAKYKKTANGQTPKEGVTCAAPRRIPFGTVLHIEGVGLREVQDRLATKYDARVDIYFESHQAALNFGKRVLKVNVHRNAPDKDTPRKTK